MSDIKTSQFMDGKTKQLADKGGQIIRKAVIVRMTDGKECCVDIFGRCDWITSRPPDAIEGIVLENEGVLIYQEEIKDLLKKLHNITQGGTLLRIILSGREQGGES